MISTITEAIFFVPISVCSQHCLYCTIIVTHSKQLHCFKCFNIFISRRALAREGDYKMMSVCACVRVCVRALVSHADFSKTTTATDFFVNSLSQ